MERVPISEALTFWSAAHPAWRPNPGWPEEVGFVTWQTADTYVFIDPLVRDDLDPGVWDEFDPDVSQTRSAVVLLTAPWHHRSARAVAGRYGAKLWLHPRGRDRIADLVADVPALATPPDGIDVFVPASLEEGEVAFYLPSERALVVAEFFLGTGDGLQVLEAPSLADRRVFAESLHRLRDLAIDRVLVAHGPPVLSGGSEAVIKALDAFAR
jgi:hypothetical protein